MQPHSCTLSSPQEGRDQAGLLSDRSRVSGKLGWGRKDLSAPPAEIPVHLGRKFHPLEGSIQPSKPGKFLPSEQPFKYSVPLLLFWQSLLISTPNISTSLRERQGEPMQNNIQAKGDPNGRLFSHLPLLLPSHRGSINPPGYIFHLFSFLCVPLRLEKNSFGTIDAALK